MQPFQVYARVRPLNDRESNFGNRSTAVLQINQSSLAIADSETRETLFQLDQVFGQSIDNTYIFDSVVQPLIDTFLSGINSTVLAYGITGAGKSYTMFGKQADDVWHPGLIQLSLEYLSKELRGIQNTKVFLSYLQIYNEQVFDLLKENSQSLQILDDPVLGVVINDLQQMQISSSKAARSLIELGNTRRVVAETKANQFSSRSHAIVQIGLQRTVEDTVFTAKMSFVDLAGSQRQNVYNEQKGIRNLEGSNINRSLLTLGNCITILSEKRKGSFIPYRDSKLTRLLKESLGGNTKTAMIACISPSILSYDQTLNTLKYACRARKIQKTVHKNIRQPRNNEELKREVLRLRKQLEEKDEKKTSKFSRKQMQDFIEKLIKNIESLTLLRHGESLQLASKMRQIQLMEDQRRLIGSALAHFNESDKEQRLLIRCNTTEVAMGIKNKKLPKSISDRELCVLKNIQNQPFANIQIHKQQNQSLQCMKNISFVKGNLQNIRLRYQQQRKNVRDIVAQYHFCINQTLQTADIIEKAQRMLQRDRVDKNILSNEDRRILQKIIDRKNFDSEEIVQYNLNVSGTETKQPPCQMDFKIKGVHTKEPRNRYLSSLEEIRKLRKRITGNVSCVQGEQLFADEGQNYQEFNCMRQLVYPECIN